MHQEVEEQRAEYQELRANRALPDGTAMPPQPYEAISAKIQSIAHRTGLNSSIFPADVLLAILCEYALTSQQDASIGADPSWPVLLFLQLGVPHVVVVRALERILEAHEAPFTGRRRKFVVECIDTAVESWVKQADRRGGEKVPSWVAELMNRALQAVEEILGGMSAGTRSRAEVHEVVDRTRTIRQAAVGAVEDFGTLRFR
jgi:nuclear pore complex protein Nup155